jgi:hypothetical protein
MERGRENVQPPPAQEKIQSVLLSSKEIAKRVVAFLSLASYA